MTMGHRVAVLKDARLQQVDTPRNLYEHPANVFVAEFIGSPRIGDQVCVSLDAGTAHLFNARTGPRLAA
jgi:multiple sugar transport system ATP-binding protein